MMRTRITSAVLFTAAVLSLGACSDDDKTEAGASSAGTSTATSAAAAPPVGATSAAAAGGASDKAICEETNKAGEAMKESLLGSMKDGDFQPAEAKKMLEDFSTAVTAAAGSGTSKIATGAKSLADIATKSASAADPLTAVEDPAFEKAGTELAAACQAAGVKVNL
ncbi:hypothetical protein [Actinoplanes siamensis]|uniref:Lipoprotein n=1 Tax=Actinoplanes siamensis TaxID=1223317 RepID=A0A919N8T6_9ACTN|nr:hypothetical protein [Actinoplanes siamensis]GIF06604.1 hypothetical protein Asi03nite_41420 [Actinoplanes siamensis]